MSAFRSRLRARAAALALTLLLAAGIVSGAGPQAPASPQPPAGRVPAETRALWVQRTSLTSPDQITRLVRDAKAAGFNTLLVQVRGRGDAYFSGALEPAPPQLSRAAAGFDPLAQTLSAAHAAGLRVHAWTNVNLIASATMLPTDPAHIVHAHPEWLMLPRSLAPDLARLSPRDPAYVSRLATWTRAHSSQLEGLYSSPIPIDAAHHVEAVITDLVSRYNVDGVHLDYIRYPTAEFDYSTAALAAFREFVINDLTTGERAPLDAKLARNPFIYTDTFPARWTTFRRARLTDLVARLRATVKQHRPDALLTAAVKPDANEAMQERLQDWQDWASRGLLDVICPMAYTPDLARFATTVAGVRRSAAPQPFWAGIGAYRLDSAQTVAHIRAARAAGASGIALFSYDSLTAPVLKTIGRAAFGETVTPVASISTH